MIIKTFTAESSAAALKQVRAELGREAVVLKTREVTGLNGASRIEITACLDGASPLPQPQAAPALGRTGDVRPAVFKTVSTPARESINRLATPVPVTNEVPAQIIERLNRIEKMVTTLARQGGLESKADAFEPVRVALRNSDTPAAVIDALIAKVGLDNLRTPDPSNAVRAELIDVIEKSIAPALIFKPGDRVLFAGPAGSGKTSALGKLAARLVFQEHRKVTLVTVDSAKIGAFEELQSYADILGANSIDHHTATKKIDPSAVTLIDTPSWPSLEDQQKNLLGLIDALKPTYRIIAVPVTMRSVDLADTVSRMNGVNPTHHIATMLDLTPRWGGILTAIKPEVPLLFTTGGAAGIGTVEIPNAEKLADQILAGEVRHD